MLVLGNAPRSGSRAMENELRLQSEVLYVQMLGGLSLRYGDRPVSLNCSITNKAMQLLLLLLYSDGEGIKRNELLEELYGRESGIDPANNLNATVFRLRKILTAAGIPKEKYISINKGVYSWSGSIPVCVDAHEFECRAVKALETEGEAQMDLLKESCERYTGEFLPILGGEAWVAVAAVKYQNLYFSCLREACRQMKERREYEEMLKLCTAATVIYPFEEWQVLQIDCLIAMNHYKEALKVYEKATALFFEELGLSPSEQMLGRFRAISGQLHYTAGSISDIRESLNEQEWDPNAYCCTYPSFIDCYHLVLRTVERTRNPVNLLLCTLMGADGKTPEDDDCLRQQADRLNSVIGHCLRRGDVYTRYSPNQFLLLLIGAAPDHYDIVTGRIDRSFHSGEGEVRMRVEYYVTPIEKFKRD